jgi:hypothetical protein
MHRILSLPLKLVRVLLSSASNAVLSAFFFSGRFKVSQAIPSSSETFDRTRLLFAIGFLL